MNKQTFTTANEVKDMITTAIESGHAASADDFDLDMILEATYRYNPETQRFEQTGTTEEFWEAVESSIIDMAAEEHHEAAYNGMSNYDTWAAAAYCANVYEIYGDAMKATRTALAHLFHARWATDFQNLYPEANPMHVDMNEVYDNLHN